MSTPQHQHHRHHHHHAHLANSAADAGSVQLLAYQIYQEKGGGALDNWLEAEQALKHNH
ncbi:MAG: DUF2934 domain-containing protein [Candidatus Omnitrophica bacterium]|nr:DUF2934 domain-containing protein [Candidatus Omnitrophota bacterium]